MQKLRYHHLRAYLACGVTSVLDNGISAPVLREFQNYLESGGIGPNIYALAPAFYTPQGYLANDFLTPSWGPHWQSTGSLEDIESLFSEYEGISNIVGIKTFLEPGMGALAIWPMHSPEIRKILIAEARKRNLPIYIHALKKKEQEAALDMGAYTLAHSGFMSGSPSDKFIKKMKKQGTHLTTTLASTMEQLLARFYPERLEDELHKLTVPKEELITAGDEEAWDQMFLTLVQYTLPKWVPSFLLKKSIKMYNIEKFIHRSIKNASRAILKMHNAGIPIVIGSDTSNWPVFINFFHGPSTIREVELLGKAGMPQKDVLLSATKIPSKMMGVDNLIGSVEIGKRADLIVLRDDPLKDLTALRTLMWTIKDGEARTPEDWMKK